MVDYKNACIYKICCKDPNIKDVYIGSTCNLIRRRAEHKSYCNNEKNSKYNFPVYRFIRDHGGWANWIMLKIKDTPCDNIDELRLKEREEFEKIGATLNSLYPQRSKKEYIEENKEWYEEYHKEYQKEYYEKNKEEINKKQREHYEKNKEEISEKQREHYEKNKEEINKKHRERYEKNKEEISEKGKEKIECPCGSVVSKGYLSKHKKTQKHQNYLKSLEENKKSLV